MFKSIDPRSPTPLYAQIADRIRLAVAAGELVKGESLPSVRALATQLRVNPATIVQAYRELERDRILEMRQGSGTFVADVPTETRAKEKSVAAQRFVRQMLTEAARQGLSPSDLHTALERELPESK
ncbi:MAG: GntR family transcriptional regulator [Gemmatimonadetes bacterium]|nr:GntR family transcriptional regulator [Gemmatimonadota bacterium]MBP7550874.1 GntR family transcriptional regulator [Gemmatimonadaceae bacterium]